MNLGVIQRFIDKIEYSQDGCWHWTGAVRGKSGYGAFKYRGKVQSTHRVAYMIFVEEIPDSLHVCHQCDNRLCVNPDHLFLGTHSDNMKDAYKKGRVSPPMGIQFTKGNIPSNATITEKEAKQVKKAIIDGKRLVDISRDLGIKYMTVVDVKRGKSFRNVEI